MKVKEKICIALSLTILSCGMLASCGGKDNDSSTDSANTSVSTAIETVDVTSVADKLKSDIAYKDTLTELSADMIQKLFGLAADTDYKAGKVYVGSGGATAEEIACFEANDADGAAKIKTVLEERVESQKTAFENYQPQEMDKLNDPVLVVKDNCVFMCISDDNAKAQEIIG
ncbi:MAG: DUF4358 domain-containing protein [Oscillospiraceae bacterium]